MQEKRVGFIGAGKMATALASGMVNQGYAADLIRATDPVPTAREAFQKATGSQVCETIADLSDWAEVFILAVKPHQTADVLKEVSRFWDSSNLLISIAAGIHLSQLAVNLPDAAKIVRVMPNTPAMVGASASAFACNEHVTQDEQSYSTELLSAVGIAECVPESLLDAVTGLSGSGPAYVYQMIEALSDGAVSVGLPRAMATRFAAQTLFGAAKMVLETGIHPGELKDMVTSPGGTTIEGLHALENGGLRGTLMNAVRAAANKSKEMGK